MPDQTLNVLIDAIVAHYMNGRDALNALAELNADTGFYAFGRGTNNDLGMFRAASGFETTVDDEELDVAIRGARVDLFEFVTRWDEGGELEGPWHEGYDKAFAEGDADYFRRGE